MTADTARSLACAEYDFVRIDTALKELAALLASVCDSPECRAAARRVKQARRHLLGTLELIDGPVTAAIAEMERMEPAPF